MPLSTMAPGYINVTAAVGTAIAAHVFDEPESFHIDGFTKINGLANITASVSMIFRATAEKSSS